MSTITRGVRKVSENILSDGRAIIVTEKDKNKYKWSDIPLSSKFIDSKTGIEWVKLEGESDWVPAHAKNDGTLCIAKDTRIKNEIYTILTLDDGNGFFSCRNQYGEVRHFQFDKNGFYFKLEEGHYEPNRNLLTVVLDDVLTRTAASGGVKEIDEQTILVTDELNIGQKVQITYASVIRIGNPYPRIFMTYNEPPEAEVGDLYINPQYTHYQEKLDDDGLLSWGKIKDTPTSLLGYGIKDKLAAQVHTHQYKDIVDPPTTMTANGGKADTADKLTNPHNIILNGFVNGTASFDGSADAKISTTLDTNSLHQAIRADIGVNNVVNYIKTTTTNVSVITGLMTANVGAVIPIPAGYDRSQCKFCVYPLTFQTTVQTTLQKENKIFVPVTFSLGINIVNGMITSNNNIGIIGYYAIGVKAGGM